MTARALAPATVEHGDGTVVNFSTGLANMGVATGSVYSSSKGAVESLTRAWAAELGPSGVRVNAISPGIIVTPGLDAVSPGILELTNGDPAGRPGQPERSPAASRSSSRTPRATSTGSCSRSTAEYSPPSGPKMKVR